MFSWASVTKRHRYKCAPGDVLLPKENRQGERFGLPTEQRGEDELHMKMISNITFGCLSALVLLNLVGANPVSNMQVNWCIMRKTFDHYILAVLIPPIPIDMFIVVDGRLFKVALSDIATNDSMFSLN